MSEKRRLDWVAPPPAEARPAARPESPPPNGLAVPEPDAPPPAAPGDFGARVRQLLGREPSGLELAEFVRVRDALGLRDNDALWLVLLALQHQRQQFEQAIEGQRRAFEASVSQRLEETRQTTDALIESARSRFLAQFPAALRQAARRVTIRARSFDGPVVSGGLIAGLALLIAGLGGAVGLAYALGERAGYERGMRVAQADVAPAPKPPAPHAKGR